MVIKSHCINLGAGGIATFMEAVIAADVGVALLAIFPMLWGYKEWKYNTSSIGCKDRQNKARQPLISIRPFRKLHFLAPSVGSLTATNISSRLAHKLVASPKPPTSLNREAANHRT